MAWLPKNNVVVPIDFSEHSFRALATAAEMVAGPTHLHAIHVLPALMVTEPGMLWTDIDDERRKEHALEVLRERTAEPRYRGVNLVAEIGDCGHRIVDFAQRIGSDLIVMPSHGRTGLKHLLIGSVAERVVRLAHCPVLVLRS